MSSRVPRRIPRIKNIAAPRIWIYKDANTKRSGARLDRTPKAHPVMPPELYRNIIEYVTDTRDLYHLSLTSRICYNEAQRVLYREIDLAQNTRTPVLWASVVIRNPQKGAETTSLTLRFDLPFLIVPEMMLPSLTLIAQALKFLPKLERLVLIGHPKAMMDPIYTWILEGCTPNLLVFHNHIFPTPSIIPFLSRQRNLMDWSQVGERAGGRIEAGAVPHLTSLDAHASTLWCFTTSRPLIRIRLKVDYNWNRERAWERYAIESLALFRATLSILTLEHSATSLNLDEVLFLLSQATPGLRTLVYSGKSAIRRDSFSHQCVEQLSNFRKLRILALDFLDQLYEPTDHCAITKHAFERCPSLQYVALRDRTGCFHARRKGTG